MESEKLLEECGQTVKRAVGLHLSCVLQFWQQFGGNEDKSISTVPGFNVALKKDAFLKSVSGNISKTVDYMRSKAVK